MKSGAMRDFSILGSQVEDATRGSINMQRSTRDVITSCGSTYVITTEVGSDQQQRIFP